MADKTFTRDQLAEYDGRDGGEAFVSFEGTIYDMTDSPMWIDGDHESEHQAGRDLTEAMADAPHGSESLQGFPAVGVLID